MIKYNNNICSRKRTERSETHGGVCLVKYNYIIYHNKCIDGFTGFYLFIKTKQWSSKPIVYPDNPFSKEIPKDIYGKNVIIIDVAYSASVVKEIAKRANKLLFIDHHKSIKNDIRKLKLKKPHEIVYDEKQSGASLVWNYFYKTKMPTFVKHVKNNDIGNWKKDKDILPFISGLEVNFKLDPTHKNLKEWDKLLDERYVKSLIEEGRMYMKYKDYLINKFARKYSIQKFPSKMVTKMNKTMLNKIGQYKVAVVNGGCPNVSLLGKKIVETADVDFCMIWTYQVDRKKFIVSLRSKKTDISQIASYFGGGGHKFAAAFSFSSDDYRIDDLFATP